MTLNKNLRGQWFRVEVEIMRFPEEKKKEGSGRTYMDCISLCNFVQLCCITVTGKTSNRQKHLFSGEFRLKRLT